MPSPPPLVSVLLPVRDAECHLRQALDSLDRQSLEHFEVVTVDDGSSDASGAMLQAWRPRTGITHTHIQQPACGISAALSAAVHTAQGQLLARMDADDISAPTRLEKQSRHLTAHPEIGLVSCQVLVLDNLGGGNDRHVAWLNRLLTSEEIHGARFIDAPVAHPSVMFRRELVTQWGGYREGAFPEDYELWLRWLHHGVRFEKLPEPLLAWRDGPTRLSRTDPRYSTAAFWRLKTQWLLQELARRAPIELWIAPSTSVARKRLRSVISTLPVQGYVDLDPRRIDRLIEGRPIIHPRDLPPPSPTRLLLTALGGWGVRESLDDWLRQRHWQPGVHTLHTC
ncbi:MAG: glycosyltransferase [Verrucomicrobiales bacterium]|nr:glycosyltransferase [Verrucomicrobiales bacterium]